MAKIRGFVCLILVAVALAGCAATPVALPPDYYENDLHHGYPGPGITDPSAQ